MTASPHILVTGASGFIGRRLLAQLRTHGMTVSALGRNACAMEGVDDIRLEQPSANGISQALAGKHFDAVLHLAAAGTRPEQRDADILMQINSLLPPAMVAAAAQCGARAMVMSGSSAEYRAALAPIRLHEDMPLCTDKLYGASKAAGTLLASARAAMLTLPLAVLRLFNVYGPGEAPHRLLPSLFSRLSNGETVALSAGKQIRDFVHVDDVCTALLNTLEALLTQSMCAGIYNVASGQANSVADFARTTCAVLGCSPALLQFGVLPPRADDLPFVVGDSSRLFAACGWRPRYTMASGIAAALNEVKLKSARTTDMGRQTRIEPPAGTDKTVEDK